MKKSTGSILHIILLLSSCSFSSAGVVDTSGSITFFDLVNIGLTGGGKSYSHKAEIVYFHESRNSLQLPPYHRLVVNLMFPPKEYSDLCEYPFPQTIESSNIYHAVVEENKTTTQPDASDRLDDFSVPLEYEFSPIAFLVPLRHERSDNNATDCDLLTKIQVALKYKQYLVGDNRLWSIIFYNDFDDHGINGADGNSYESNEVYSMGIPNHLDSSIIPGLDGLILVTVSQGTGTWIHNQMDRAIGVQYSESIEAALMQGSNDTFAPQYMLNRGNLQWQYPVSLERGANVPFRGSDSAMDDENNWRAYTFIWFRFVIFTMIICFPFVRCFRLWWGAGGRIMFRRNERGWIIGLSVQPPSDDWYSNVNGVRMNNGGAAPDHRRCRLTKEQVLGLPEITYDGYPEGSENGEDDLVDVNLDTGTSTDDEANLGASGITQEHKEPATSISITDEENTNSVTTRGNCESNEFSHTISSTCSICIDEFEHGETIRLLPRCGHGFHTECILPWLTERQGCCPFCKTNVLASADDEVNENESVHDENVLVEQQQQPESSDEENQQDSQENDEPAPARPRA